MYDYEVSTYEALANISRYRVTVSGLLAASSYLDLSFSTPFLY